MDSQKLQKIGGICAIFEALIYIIAFIIYGKIIILPKASDDIVEKLSFLKDNYLILLILNLLSYVLFGVLLAVLVLAIHQRIKNYSTQLSNLTSIFGIIWVGLVIASGMIANIGLSTVIDIGNNEPENAMLIWRSVGIVTEGLGGGNEIVGGIWMLLLSIISFKSHNFSKSLNSLGILVGIAGILTIYPLDIFSEVFGISQIIWFLWIGISMTRKSIAG